jgi:eukaryotic-like serine/threonine-protein kinase
MPLSRGSRLGPYEIQSALGAGGMGEVYCCRDTKLGRDVAVKILPETFTHDPERIARFRREAQVLASLNHPHIGAIYGLDEANGQQFLVLELVDGESLDKRIARGALPVDEALGIAKQIAEALEAAHEKGIIHRDLKPANIALTKDGNVKVLDFGLAKATEAAGATSLDLANSPTITSPAMMTGMGMILGTAAYMSPEQAKGRPADKRSDIWAFGCVLYEMLTGKRAFEGEDVSDTLAAVLRGEPDWTALPRHVLPNVLSIVQGSLAKDRTQRISDIGVVRFLMNDRRDASGTSGAAPSLWKRAFPAVVSVSVAAPMALLVAWTLRGPAPSPVVTRFAIPLKEGQQFTNNGRQLLAVSPDGSRVVYVANNQLYLRAMSESNAQPIAGTESGQTTSPVFSPDGRSIAFWSSGALKRIAISGGAAVTICPAVNPFGMSWDDDEILLGQGSQGIMRVSANGGTPQPLVAAKTGELAHGPQMLPDRQAVLFTLATGTSDRSETWDKAQVMVQSLPSGQRKTLVSGGADARYIPTGHLVYVLAGVVFAARFDPRRLDIIGGPVPIIEGVARAGAFQTGVAHFVTSNNGSLVYVPGPASTSSAQQTVAFLDRQGRVEPLKLPLGPYEHPRVSNDGTRLAVGTDDGKASAIWIYDLAGASARRQLTFGGRNRFPIWSADGQRVAFQSDREGDVALFWQRADGAGAAERLTKPERETTHVPESWAPDGQTLLLAMSKESRVSLHVLSLPSKQTASYGGVEASSPISAAFSPDGRWVAYSYGGPGNTSTFVQPFPATGAKYLIAAAYHPFWSPDGRELFFHPRGSRFEASAITTKPSFSFASPLELPTGNLVERATFERNIDITPDGKRFVGVIASDQTQSGTMVAPQIQVVLNWFEELKRRAPTK